MIPAVDSSLQAEINLSDDTTRRRADKDNSAATGHNDINEQSAMHDPDVLSHTYEQKDLEKIFQPAEAPDELDRAPTGRCICSSPECGDCFPGMAPEFGPPITNAEAGIMSPAETNGAEVVLQWSSPFCIDKPRPGPVVWPRKFFSALRIHVSAKQFRELLS